MPAFDFFVVFAEMRTGSNFLEQNLNQIDGIRCLGEAFNPNFIGFPKNEPIFGVTLEERDKNPKGLLRAIRKDKSNLNGFRYFHDHDPRVLDKLIDDRRAAKIVLTRNPAESYVSWKIAVSTDQWKLTDSSRRRSAQAAFDEAEFRQHVETLQRFQVKLLNRLQALGQTAFYIAYEDLQSIDAINGLARFLGVEGQLKAIDRTLKVQNPAPLSEKVENFDAMQRALAGVDRFNLTRTPNFEPRRGPAVPKWVTGATTPLLYMPIRSASDDTVCQWMADLDGVDLGQLGGDLGQGAMRDWLEAHANRRTFCVLRHPLDRAHDVFCDKILPVEGGYSGIRTTLVKRYKVPLPETFPDAGYGLEQHRAAFVAFLEFLKANLSDQTAIRVDPLWATQAQTIQGFAEFLLPDRLLRESELPEALPELARAAGHRAPPPFKALPRARPFPLSEIYDAKIETMARSAYGRDYTMFGFADWA